MPELLLLLSDSLRPAVGVVTETDVELLTDPSVAVTTTTEVEVTGSAVVVAELDRPDVVSEVAVVAALPPAEVEGAGVSSVDVEVGAAALSDVVVAAS